MNDDDLLMNHDCFVCGSDGPHPVIDVYAGRALLECIGCGEPLNVEASP